MRTKRKVVLNFIESGDINNARLIEYLANKYKERGIENEGNSRT